MKHNLLIRLATLLGAIVLTGNVWGESYTITFKSNSGDGSNVSTSTACSDIVSAGADYLSGNVVTATKVYYNGGSGLKLGTSDDAGTIRMNLSTTGQVTPTSIVVRAKRYSSYKATNIKVNGSAAQGLSEDFADYTFNITSKITYLELVSSKGTSGGAYCWVESITVNYTAADLVTSLYLSEAGVQSENLKGSYKIGDSYTLPSSVTNTCEGKTFVGWSTEEITTPGDKPTSNYYEKGAQVTLAANNTFYAVFADAEGGEKVEGIPVEYDGSGSLTLSEIPGVTIFGLGSDYDSNTQGEYILRFDNTGDYIQFALDYAPTKLSFNYKMVGGNSTSTMAIQECASAEGEYTNVQSFSISGSQNSTGTKTTTNSFSQKYIRMYFTKGSNVGVGKITIKGYISTASYSNYTTTCDSKTLSSISVKTAPTKTTYTEGETFDPTGLVITKTYSDASTEDFAYAGNESAFTFEPSLETALTTDNTPVTITITVDGKSTTQAITVSASVKYDISFVDNVQNTENIPGTTDNELSVAKNATFTFPTIPDKTAATTGDCEEVHYHFMGWVLSTHTGTITAGDIKTGTSDAVTAAVTYKAVWAKEE